MWELLSILLLITFTVIVITHLRRRKVNLLEESTSWEGTGEGTGQCWPTSEPYFIYHNQKIIKGLFISILLHDGIIEFYKSICASVKQDLKITLRYKDDFVKFVLPSMMKAYVNNVYDRTYLLLRTTNSVQDKLKFFWDYHNGAVCWITNIEYKLIMIYSHNDISELGSQENAKILMDAYIVLGPSETRERFQYNLYWSGNIPVIDKVRHVRPIAWEYIDS